MAGLPPAEAAEVASPESRPAEVLVVDPKLPGASVSHLEGLGREAVRTPALSSMAEVEACTAGVREMAGAVVPDTLLLSG